MKHYDIDDLTLDRLSHNTLIALHTVFIKKLVRLVLMRLIEALLSYVFHAIHFQIY